MSIYISMTTKMTTYVDRQPPLERCPPSPLANGMGSIHSRRVKALARPSDHRFRKSKRLLDGLLGRGKLVDNYPPYLDVPGS